MRAIIADDHPMCREASRIALVTVRPDAEILFAGTAADVVREAGSADLVLLDLGLPDSKGAMSLLDVAKAAPEALILVVSGSEQEGIQSFVAGQAAAGFVSKAAPLTELIAAIRAVLAGERWFTEGSNDDGPAAGGSMALRVAQLSPAERRVLTAMRGGQLNKQIAFDLSLSEITVKQHLKAILRKLGVINRTQAVLAIHSVENEGVPLV